MALRANRGLEEDCPDQLVFRDLCASGMRAETLRQHARNRLGRIVGGRYLPNDRAMASIPAHPRTMFSLSALTGSEEHFMTMTRVFGLHEGAHLNGLGIFEADEHLRGVGVCAGRLGGNLHARLEHLPVN
jgi:hypothetical protein